MNENQLNQKKNILYKSKEETKKLINDRINIIDEILSLPIKSEKDLIQIEEKFKQWKDFNLTLLQTLFSDKDFIDSHFNYYPIVSSLEKPLKERSKQLSNEINDFKLKLDTTLKIIDLLELYVDPSEKTLIEKPKRNGFGYDEIINYMKNHWIIKYLLLIGIAIILLWQFTDALQNLYNFFIPSSCNEFHNVNNDITEFSDSTFNILIIPFTIYDDSSANFSEFFGKALENRWIDLKNDNIYDKNLYDLINIHYEKNIGEIDREKIISEGKKKNANIVFYGDFYSGNPFGYFKSNIRYRIIKKNTNYIDETGESKTFIFKGLDEIKEGNISNLVNMDFLTYWLFLNERISKNDTLNSENIFNIITQKFHSKNFSLPNTIAATNIAQMYEKNSSINKASFYFTEALNISPDIPSSYLELANFKQRTNKPIQEVLELYNKALQIDSNYYPAIINIGAMYALQNNFRMGIKYFLKSLEYNKEESTSLMNLVYCYFKINSCDSSKIYFKQLEKIKVESEFQSNLNYIIPTYYIKCEHDIEKAKSFMISSLNLDKKNIYTYYQTGHFFESDYKDDEIAIKYYRLGLEQDSLNLDKDFYSTSLIYLNLGTLYLKQNKINTCIDFLLKGLKSNKKNLSEASQIYSFLYRSLGWAYGELKEYKMSAYYYKKSIESYNSWDKLKHWEKNDLCLDYYLLAWTNRFKLKNNNVAKNKYLQVIRLCENTDLLNDSLMYKTYFQLGQIFLNVNPIKKDSAKIYLLKASKIDSENWGINFNLGVLYQEQFKDFETAIKYHKKSLRIKETSEVLKKISILYSDWYESGAKKYLDSAILYNEKTLKLLPNDAATHNNLGILYSKKTNKYSLSESHYFLAIQHDSTLWQAYLNYANLLKIKLKKDSLACINYRKSFQLNPSDELKNILEKNCK